MSDKTSGPFAFPSHGNMGEVCHEGMNLRDYFAAKALQGMLADWKLSATEEEFSERAFKIADAMLAEREK